MKFLCKAFDPDLDDVIRYVIKPNSYSTNNQELNSILENPFELNSATGVLTLNFQVLATMKGFIEFQIQAFDLGLIECNTVIIFCC